MPREIHIYRIVATSINEAIQKAQRHIRLQTMNCTENAAPPNLLAAYCAETGQEVNSGTPLFSTPPTVDRILELAKGIRFELICDAVSDDHAHWRESFVMKKTESISTGDFDGAYLRKLRADADNTNRQEFIETVGSTMDERHFLTPTLTKMVADMNEGLPGSIPLLGLLADEHKNYPFSSTGNLANNRLWDTQMITDKGTEYYAFAMINQ